MSKLLWTNPPLAIRLSKNYILISVCRESVFYFMQSDIIVSINLFVFLFSLFHIAVAAAVAATLLLLLLRLCIWAYRLNYPLKLRKWHHMCTSWNGKTGEWQLWVKAERVGRGFHNRVSEMMIVRCEYTNRKSMCVSNAYFLHNKSGSLELNRGNRNKKNNWL